MEPLPVDDELIAAAVCGEVEAFGQLVRRYQDRLFHTLCLILRCEADARDVSQDAFVQAFVKLESFQHKAGFYTWLYRIALNLAASRRRRTRPSRSLDELRERCADEPLDRGDSPECELDRCETVEQVRDAIAQLPDEFRETLVLREIEGCDYDTIAAMLEIPVGTVRSRLHRARLQLRELLSALNERSPSVESSAVESRPAPLSQNAMKQN